MKTCLFGQLGVAGMLLAFLAAPGCREKPRNFTPTVAVAEGALRQGLDAWKAGQPAGEIPGKPVVYVTDVGRKPDQTLESYQILGETRGSMGRTIAVTLRLKNPDEEIKARYIIIGIDPLWVYRQEDYELLMHWEHRMPEKKEPEKTQPAPDSSEQAAAEAGTSEEKIEQKQEAEKQPEDQGKESTDP